jgi:serine/threonine protein kinase
MAPHEPSIAEGTAPQRKSTSSDPMIANDGWIGDRYRIIDKLGEGGFGLVYRAEQVKPIHRMVALKILKAGMDSSQIIGRFEAERQALALMEHPNIARVLDAGETENGRSFFVMELVRGRSITSYASRHELTLEQKLELFIHVCAAVHHAHQKGIIHRDLKPSNVLVMTEDGEPVPKVIDFGIAKALEGPLAGETVLTGMDQLIGTPGYMSPEQVDQGAGAVDTRSDVYALGSILFELMSGKPLVTPMDMAQKPLHQLLAELADREPPKPSTFAPELKGDLDWIALKSLERDPDRRYGSADALADDLHRYLTHQPVTARPPSRLYLTQKFVRRHRVGVAATLSILFAVIAGGVASTVLYFQAEESRRAATQSREDLRKSYSRSDEQMARQFTERGRYTSSVAYLCRALRTDPDNTLASTNLLSLLGHVHLLQPLTPSMPLPKGARGARLTAVSREAATGIAVSTTRPTTEQTPRQDVLSFWNLETMARTDHRLPEGTIGTCLETTPDGALAALGRDDGGVELWVLGKHRSLNLEPSLPSAVLCMTISGDGRKLMAGGEDGTIHLWDLDNPQVEAATVRQPFPVTSLAIDEMGHEAVTAGTEGRVLSWDLIRGEVVCDSIEVDVGLACVAMQSTRHLVALGMNDGLVYVGDYRSGAQVVEPFFHPAPVTQLQLSADGKDLMVGDAGGYLHVWDLESGKLKFPARQHDGEMVLDKLSKDQGLLSSASRHGEVQVWDRETGQRVQHRLQTSIASLNASNDSSTLLVAPREEPTVQAWSIYNRMTHRRYLAPPDEALIPKPPVIPSEAPKAVRHASAWGWNRSSSLVGATDFEGGVQVYDAASWQPVGEPISHPPAVGVIALNEDGSRLVTSGRDRAVRVWNTLTGEGTGVALRHETFVVDMALSPDGKRLVTVTEPGEIRVWVTESGECLTPAIRAGSEIEGVRISDDGQDIQFRVVNEGWFALPMPPEKTRLPDWFVRLAEAWARQSLTDEGKLVPVSWEDYRQSLEALPESGRPSEAIARRWAQWLTQSGMERSLSPRDTESLNAYIKSLIARNDPWAAREVLRLQPRHPGALAILEKGANF